MPRNKESRAAARRSSRKLDGCLDSILQIFFIDFILNALIDLGCAGCMSLIALTCLAVVYLTHGIPHFLSHRLMAVSWRSAGR